MTTVRIVSRPAGLAALAIVAALGLGACSSGTNPSAIASAIANASLPPLPSPAATPLPSAPASQAAAAFLSRKHRRIRVRGEVRQLRDREPHPALLVRGA